ncbi:alpha-1,6-mannosyltransferase [Allocatelliglobosispora scoriae]|uniref:Alpha-1,6-mannosyltransferase n=1 Tax=Allocatelliglobosispora scoriae TaxID=643052 RepID=A0A841BMF8_9ACTN|nr:glycosyltransferase [Allocatelliglobosispora scoriae]MBB5867942.1 alpha-1,6-mannosyltransferase [Allocatelliglobosispora scoriae]
MRPLRIVRLANFVTPSSGGLRTALRELGRGYLDAGHHPVLVTPGPAHSDSSTEQGRVITLPGPLVPGLGGYRVLLRRRPLTRLLAELRPDVIEVSDRSTLRWTGRWAARHGVASVMVSHESLDGLLAVAGLPTGPRTRVADRLNRATARRYDTVVCTTRWAAAEFDRVGAGNVRQVPLGVDLTAFHPGLRSATTRAAYAEPGEVLIVCCTRLSVEKRPQRALTTLRGLLAAGVPARLVIAGDGPLRANLTAAAADLPVTFTGWISDRPTLAGLLASADAAIAPGPIETFGLAALECLATGTPVVASADSALPGVLGAAGLGAVGDDFTPALRELLARPERDRRTAARSRAEQFGWQAAADGFLAVFEELVFGPPALPGEALDFGSMKCSVIACTVHR